MKEVAMVQDIVCGMDVDETDGDVLVREFGGQKFYFCSVECKLLFGRDPLLYVIQSIKSGETTKDIVCGIVMDKEKTFASLKYHGQWFYFCSEACRREFQRNSQQYLTS